MRRFLSAGLLILACCLPSASAEEPREVMIEVRLVEVPTSLVGQLQAPAGHLNDRQVSQWLTQVQADARCNVLMAPRLTAEDGQKARIAIGTEESPELAVDLHPCITPTGEAIKLSLCVQTKDTPKPLEQVVHLGNGQTALIRGWERPGPRVESIPALAKLPVLGVLFQREEEPRTVFVLATARLVP